MGRLCGVIFKVNFCNYYFVIYIVYAYECLLKIIKSIYLWKNYKYIWLYKKIDIFIEVIRKFIENIEVNLEIDLI